MLFNTLSYVFFLAISVLAYWSLPRNFRLYFLLAASLLFYGLWRWEFVFLIVFSAAVDYAFSLLIAGSEDERRRRIYLLLSLGTNIGLLIYFKYTYFIIDNIALASDAAAQSMRTTLGAITLPLGISFYTFLSISYTIDVYRREYVPVRSFVTYLTYVMFWPHMIAGPILRAHELLPQLIAPGRITSDDVAAGSRLIIFGLFLKVGLADQIAPSIDEAFAMSPMVLGGLDVWTMAFGFGFQIYFDFAGYSMIAIGSARLLGIGFPDNFNWPYLASSPREFWRRWHITLSSWIRDYLYLPLSGLHRRSHSTGGIDVQFGGSGTSGRTISALLATWLIMGLWHGASWTFALWGLWHATFILLYRLISPHTDFLGRLPNRILGWGLTLAIAMLGWIPFRATSVEHALALYGRVFDLSSYRSLGLRESFYLNVALLLVGMIALYGVTLAAKRITSERHRQAADFVEIGGVAIAVFVVFVFLRPISQFIYFQF